jgi:tRNA G46 methylase TrmB
LCVNSNTEGITEQICKKLQKGGDVSLAIDENTSFAEMAIKLAQEADEQENTSTKTIEESVKVFL